MQFKAPLVTFVVPCFNYGRYLAECLHSILSQDGNFHFEVVVIDDGSTDNTAEVMRSFPDPRIRTISHPHNMGHVFTINEGLREARGSFIARIDPDDRYRPYFLSVVMEKFQAFPEVGLVYGNAALINERGEITAERCDRAHAGRDFTGNEFVPLLEENFICAPTVMARREAWYEALPVPEGLAFNDWYFTLTMARSYSFYYMDRVVADYRVHRANHHSRIIQDKTEESSIFRLLDCVFSQPERSAELEGQKQAARRRIYGAHYLTLANKYFGFHMNADARRCYVQAVRYGPRYASHPAVIRRLAATCLGRKPYEFLKSQVQAALSAFGRSAS